MSNDVTAVQAFNIGAGADTVSSLNWLMPALIFAVLFIVIAYIIVKMFEEVKEGKLKLNKFGQIAVRLAVMICILGYFLLHH